MLRRLMMLSLCVLAAALGLAAAFRPYADNQRNWMTAGAVVAAVGALALLTSGALAPVLARVAQRVVAR